MCNAFVVNVLLLSTINKNTFIILGFTKKDNLIKLSKDYNSILSHSFTLLAFII